MASDIIVRGEGEVRALPDRAGIRVTIDGDGSSQEQAYETAARVAAPRPPPSPLARVGRGGESRRDNGTANSKARPVVKGNSAGPKYQ